MSPRVVWRVTPSALAGLPPDWAPAGAVVEWEAVLEAEAELSSCLPPNIDLSLSILAVDIWKDWSRLECLLIMGMLEGLMKTGERSVSQLELNAGAGAVPRRAWKPGSPATSHSPSCETGVTVGKSHLSTHRMARCAIFWLQVAADSHVLALYWGCLFPSLGRSCSTYTKGLQDLRFVIVGLGHRFGIAPELNLALSLFVCDDISKRSRCLRIQARFHVIVSKVVL